MSWKRDKIVQIKTFKRKLGLKALRAQLHIKANPFSKQLLFMFPLMYIIISQDPAQKIMPSKCFIAIRDGRFVENILLMIQYHEY